VFIYLVDVGGRSPSDSVPLPSVASNDVEVALPVEVSPLLRRQPGTQKALRTSVNRFLILGCVKELRDEQITKGPPADAREISLHLVVTRRLAAGKTMFPRRSGRML
jgi:hypothetical protein